MKVIVRNSVPGASEKEKNEYEFPQRQSGIIYPVGPKDGPAKYYTGYYVVKGIVSEIPVRISGVPRRINEDIKAVFELVSRGPGKFPKSARFIRVLSK